MCEPGSWDPDLGVCLRLASEVHRPHAGPARVDGRARLPGSPRSCGSGDPGDPGDPGNPSAAELQWYKTATGGPEPGSGVPAGVEGLWPQTRTWQGDPNPNRALTGPKAEPALSHQHPDRCWAGTFLFLSWPSEVPSRGVS